MIQKMLIILATKYGIYSNLGDLLMFYLTYQCNNWPNISNQLYNIFFRLNHSVNTH